MFRDQVCPGRVWGVSTKGSRSYASVQFHANDALVFGPETRGLPGTVLEELGVDYVLRMPMLPASRSLNLSNAVAVLVYEAWRQQDFAGSTELL